MAERDDVTTGAADAQAAVPGSAAAALAKHEAEKMSRRAVLAKVGLRFGAAVIAAMSVDDLTRAVTKSIARSNRDSAVAQQVANEFKNAGVAFAADRICAHCTSQYDMDIESCKQFYQGCINTPGADTSVCDKNYYQCSNDTTYARDTCIAKHC